MANQVLVHVMTSKGTRESTYQKSTRIKDEILGSRMHFRLPKEAKLVLCRQELPHADFDPDRALVNYNVIDGEVLILKEAPKRRNRWGPRFYKKAAQRDRH